MAEKKSVADDSLLREDDDVERAYRATKALSHPVRLKCLCVLSKGELSVLDIVENVGTSQSNVSQHLSILHDKGIVVSRREANRVYYRVSDPRILQLIRLMGDIFCPPVA